MTDDTATARLHAGRCRRPSRTPDGDRMLATKDFEAAGACWALALDGTRQALKIDPDLLPTWLGYLEVK